jgi:hypothetical protein
MGALSAVVVGLEAAPAGSSPGSPNDYFIFDRVYGTGGSLNSNLVRIDDGVNIGAYRAGSGNGSQDECAVNAGWLPEGWYNNGSEGYQTHKNGADIDGRAWHLQNKQCYNGTWRTGLFIHTEETVENGQSCGSGDQPHCWESANDYKSLGCIKISHPNNGFPNDIGTAAAWWTGKAVGAQEGVVYSNILYVGY